VGYESVADLKRGLAASLVFSNHERLHQSLGYRTPTEVYSGGGARAGED
jgi:putative transposase